MERRSNCRATHAFPCSISFASTFIFSVPRKAATKVRAARAPYSSTASACSRAFHLLCSARGARSPPSKGLASAEGLHPLQKAFVEHDGFQCGYCTPGQICSAVGMVDEVRRCVPSHVTADLSADRIALSHDELRERMSGNLCRCGAYNGIVAAIAETYAESST